MQTDGSEARLPRKDTTPPKRFSKELPSLVGDHVFDQLLTPERCRTFKQVLARRYQSLVIVVEDCYDPHNATAVIRTCDSLGLHRLHVTTTRCTFKVNRRISQGSHRYVDLRVHTDIQSAYQSLREDGYQIFATDLRADAIIGPQQLGSRLAAGEKIALVFGSEGFGLSKAASDLADGHILLPMAGFAQSLNLSVSVAMSIYALRGDDLSADSPGDLSADEQRRWYEHWVRQQHAQAAEALLPQQDADRVGVREPEPELSKRGEELDSFGAEMPQGVES